MLISYRAETPADETLVRKLVIDFVTADLGASAWPQPLRDHLLQTQYDARLLNLRRHHPNADRRIIFADGSPAGWLVLSSTPAKLHIIEIIVSPAHRAKGIGSTVLSDVLKEAGCSGMPVRLSVRIGNRAVRLYARLGFRRVGGDEVQHFMEWVPELRT